MTPSLIYDFHIPENRNSLVPLGIARKYYARLSNPHQLFKQELIVNDCNIGVKGLQTTDFASSSFFLSVVLVITKGNFAFVNLLENIRSE